MKPIPEVDDILRITTTYLSKTRVVTAKVLSIEETDTLSYDIKITLSSDDVLYRHKNDVWNFLRSDRDTETIIENLTKNLKTL